MKRKLVVLFVFAFLARLVLAFGTYHPDLRNHADWGLRFWDYGPGKFYSANVWNYTWPNQPPGTIYIFAGTRKLFDFVFGAFWWVNTHVPPFPSQIMFFLESNLYPASLKLPSILADLGIALLLYKLVKEHTKKLAPLAAVFFLLNPAIWYNSAVWGQTDSVISFFTLASFMLLLRRKLAFSVLLFALSLYIKASLLIFVPVFALVVWKQRYRLIDISNALTLAILVILLLTLPFSGNNPHLWLLELYKDKVFGQQLHVITANAFNLWAALTGIHEQPDSLPFGFLSYRAVGYVLFTLSLVWPLKKVLTRISVNTVFGMLTVVAFSGFILLTNMHERYLYPMFPVFTLVAVLDKRLRPTYWLVSLLYLLNMYHFWWYPKIDLLISGFEYGDRLLPRLLGLTFLVIYIYLGRKLLFGGQKLRQ
ncbi:MAG: hypothetical protein ACD_52C00051G0003 [uncultured bacterium]|nr:MAG: hypothetical protein ACD_52C00051G0003 [uncultured bacterium]